MPLPPGLLLLLLSGATATAALPLEGGPTGPDSEHMQEAAGIRKSSLRDFPPLGGLSGPPRSSAGPLHRERKPREVARRQEGAPPRQFRAPGQNALQELSSGKTFLLLP
nr:cortistatin preproprotein [Pongo abelii]